MLSSLGNTLEARRNSAIRFLPVTPDFRPWSERTEKQGFFVFGDKESFMETYNISSEPEMLSDVDFAKLYIVGIHQGLCPTGGYRIHVRRVKRYTGKAEITVDFHEPNPNEMVTLAMTTPTVFLMVPRLTREQEPPVFCFQSSKGTILAKRKPEFGKQEGV